MICESTRFVNLHGCIIICIVSLLKSAHSWGQLNVLCFFYIDHLFWMWSRSSSPYFVIYRSVSNLMNWWSLKQSETCILIWYCCVCNYVQFYDKFWSKWTNLNHAFWCNIVLSTILSNFMKNVGPWTNLNRAFWCNILVYNLIQFYDKCWSLNQSKPRVFIWY
jgi:hypothetical protein